MVGGAAVPCPAESVVVVEPARPEPGYWAGAPSALVAGADTWLAYRERDPQRRGGRVVLAHSDEAGRFDPVVILEQERFGAESLRLPIADVRHVDVVRESGGALRLYYEAPRSDGAHELRTERRPVGTI